MFTFLCRCQQRCLTTILGFVLSKRRPKFWRNDLSRFWHPAFSTVCTAFPRRSLFIVPALFFGKQRAGRGRGARRRKAGFARFGAFSTLSTKFSTTNAGFAPPLLGTRVFNRRVFFLNSPRLKTSAAQTRAQSRPARFSTVSTAPTTTAIKV